MSDIIYAFAITGIIALGAIGIAILEWFDSNPPEWVVKVRLWLHRRKK